MLWKIGYLLPLKTFLIIENDSDTIIEVPKRVNPHIFEEILYPNGYLIA